MKLSRMLVAAFVLTACTGGEKDEPDRFTPYPQIPPSKGPVVILMIGDGMGPAQLEAASLYAHGAPGMLAMESLPVRAEVSTASLSGTTDSAAAATLMATGVRTLNYRVGVDETGASHESLVELAHRLGLGAGIVTTASLPHATPGGFSAHRLDRNMYVEIADDQALDVRPDVMLGGGSQYFLPAGAGSVRSDAGLIAPLQNAGYDVAFTRTAMQAATGARLAGMFAADHMTYVVDRAPATEEPTLEEMSLTALEFLDARHSGFFLMIEGARIDMAGHVNDLQRNVTETIAFDEAIAAVRAWAKERGDVTLVVTADHECGGLDVTAPQPAGTLPAVTWRWLNHTNASVDLFADGPNASAIDGALLTHADVHELAASVLERREYSPVAEENVVDGRLGDLAHEVAAQANATGFGAGYNELERLFLDADERGFVVGIEGLFEWDQNALVLLVDVDMGAATGHGSIDGALTDTTGRSDDILESLNLTAPATAGFGADFAVVVWGGTDPRLEDLTPDAGLRGLRTPFGATNDLGWHAIATNFSDAVRTRNGTPGAIADLEGWEARLDWETIYPSIPGDVPPNATLAIAAILVNDTGTFLSNQALPPFAAMTANPGNTTVALPGLVVWQVDSNGDGAVDPGATPAVVP